MAIPFHLLVVCRNIIFAARGSEIYSFTSEFEPISGWKYPAKQPLAAATQPPAAPKPSPAPEGEGPPSKRRKVVSGQDAGDNGSEGGKGNGDAVDGQSPGVGGKKQGKEKNGSQAPLPHERPFIQSLAATTDGRHIVAITGCDKTIWVLEHDGAGNLKQLSQRIMPKRPCSLVITTDNKTILSADKFGDVYSLPLIPTPSDGTTPTPTSRSTTPSTPQPFKPQANELTVHTKRNLKALENQKLGLKTKVPEKPAEAVFEHTLLLGHVSMLTMVLYAIHPVTNNPYILTGDRDEHIRVSRGLPAQAHIIEAFCLGHEDFVSRLCIPASQPKILISGGGDDDLFVWDWAQGRLLSRTSLLDEVRKVVPDSTKLAVTRLLALPSSASEGYNGDGGGDDGRTLILVTCERVPAIFCFELCDDTFSLQHITMIPTPGNPLDVVPFQPGSSPTTQGLLVAVDPRVSTSGEGGGDSLIVLEREMTSGWELRSKKVEAQAVEGGGINPEDLDKILYTVESLRKTSDFE